MMPRGDIVPRSCRASVEPSPSDRGGKRIRAMRGTDVVALSNAGLDRHHYSVPRGLICADTEAFKSGGPTSASSRRCAWTRG
jgi:hypothetical protein